jgi:hypothetical protein
MSALIRIGEHNLRHRQTQYLSPRLRLGLDILNDDPQLRNCDAAQCLFGRHHSSN